MRSSRSNMTVAIVVTCMTIILFACGTAQAQSSTSADTYSFVYLGDLHFDKKSHHDLEWVKATMPGDLRQIEEYDRNAAEFMPGLLQRVQTADRIR